MVLFLKIKLENSFYPRMLCAMFGWHWPIGFWEKDFKILSMYFRYFVIISRYMAQILPIRCKTLSNQLSLLGKNVTLYSNKFESPSPKYPLCQIWLKLAKRFWRIRFLKISSIYFRYYYFVITSPRKRAKPFIWTNLNPQGCFVPGLLESGPVVQEKRMKKWKVYGQRTYFDRKSSLEALALVNLKLKNNDSFVNAILSIQLYPSITAHGD